MSQLLAWSYTFLISSLKHVREKLKNKKRMHKNSFFHLKFRATVEKEIKLEELKVEEQSIHLIGREVVILKFYFQMITFLLCMLLE